MRLLRFLLRAAGKYLAGFVAVSVLASAVNAGLLAVVHRALSGDRSHDWAWLFALAALGRMGTTYGMGRLLATQEQVSLRTLRAALVQKIAEVPLPRIEAMGKARLITALSDDLLRLQGSMQALTGVLSASAVAIGGSVYMAYLSPRAFALVTLLGALAFAIHRLSTGRATRWFMRARDAEETLQARQRDLVEGLRELKLDRNARSALIEQGIMASSDQVAYNRIAGRNAHLTARALGQLPAMMAIFAVLSGFAVDGTLSDSAGFVLAALYISGSTTAIIGNSGAFGLASIALGRIEELVESLTAPSAENPSPSAAEPDFAGLVLRDVTFSRPGNAFRLGPVSLTVRPGEVVFITGDNGSGKSTLGLLISGLYEPTTGHIELLGDPNAGGSFGQLGLTSAVFGDPYLFDQAWGMNPRQLEAAGPLMAELALPGADTGQGIPDPNALSQGQRRRLALVQALVRDRPVLLLDEFAANQDEEHRLWFYRQLLPRLRQAGKAVVVISHDSHYFDAADVRIHLVGGQRVDSTG